MNTDIERTENPLVPYRVVSHCRSYAEAVHKQQLVCRVDPLAFLPTYGAGIAIADGYPATGGGESSQTLLDAGEFVELAPAVAAMIETQSDEPPFRNPDAPVGDGEELPEAMS